MEIIKSQTFGHITVQMLFNEAPVFGGRYSVRSVVNGQTDIEKDGLTLDAACEVFRNSVNYLGTQKEFNSIGR